MNGQESYLADVESIIRSGQPAEALKRRVITALHQELEALATYIEAQRFMPALEAYLEAMRPTEEVEAYRRALAPCLKRPDCPLLKAMLAELTGE